MPLFIVKRKNDYFPVGTYLEQDDDGFCKVELKQKNGKWVIGKRYDIVIVPTPELIDALMPINQGLPPDIKARIRENFNK